MAKKTTITTEVNENLNAAFNAASAETATESKVHFVVISFASRTTDSDVGVIKGTEFNLDTGDAIEFERNVAQETNIPPISKGALERLQNQGYYLEYPAPIQGRTGYNVTVTDGVVTKVQRVWTDAELEKMLAERKQNVLSDYARLFKKGGNN